jgi:hypothetical protein
MKSSLPIFADPFGSANPAENAYHRGVIFITFIRGEWANLCPDPITTRSEGGFAH